jgi:glycosyltransferase involved in cell wall biosynthesis
MSTPLVSVIMPVHNAAPYVADAIRSVLAQGVEDFELILIDDASTDNSGKIIATFRDERLRYRRSDIQLNAAGARNLGLAEARGEFVAFLDADDVAHPERFAIQLELLRARSDVSVVGSLIEAMDENGQSRPNGFVRPLAVEEIPPTLLFENCIALSSIMARRASLASFQPEFAPAEDYELWARLAEKTKLTILPQRLTSYRMHPAGVSSRQPGQMRVAVDRVHALQLVRLGVKPSPIHARLAVWPLHPTWDELNAAEQWLCCLQEANERTGIYPRDVFRRIVEERWFRICFDSWTLGWPVWSAFHRSRLAVPTFTQTLRLLRRLAPRIFRR